MSMDSNRLVLFVVCHQLCRSEQVLDLQPEESILREAILSPEALSISGSGKGDLPE